LTNAQEKSPRTAGTVESQESVPAKASDLTRQITTDWREWKDLEPTMGWFTDGGEEVFGAA